MSEDLLQQCGTFLAFMLTCACLAYLSHKGWEVLRRGKQFSLRDLLIAVTLVAALFGLLVGVANQDQEGLLRFRLAEEIDRQIELEQRGK